ncbi:MULTISPECIES: NAD(P)/FAD-dependent oxidoreductase [unclassified Haladaptatus]|uniref:NAD(P)/FAD-dependent oxidoreductase n=1 Tax=unclassified Haladaptatus TaxID=2622732 RepID=UPI00209C4DD9|nr:MULTISPECIES: NAD(P)/FAD-dependent oxidoreductase [unclassified Haladaptatus]MCO8244348.1 NAD(P)/FAD-dependent oxidoreductase [Haladaptatus sp. AB643]MCO8254029.1 NAD(P)/FAD-dependent oxidoreductase [Haladaptatus sp. AB618]
MRYRRDIAVVGGAVGGLAAATAFRRLGHDVTLFERQCYDEKRVNCGEAMTAASKIPLEKTAENGFLNRVPSFEVAVRSGTETVGGGRFSARDAYITDRNTVERRWAEWVEDHGVELRANHGVSKAEFRELADEYYLVVDATGQPSLASKADGTTDEYSGRMVALNADVTGDFSAVYPRSRIVFEGYLGYGWLFPKTETRANVGVGWHERDVPDDYFAALHDACDRNGWPKPTRDETNVAIIPRGPSLDPERIHPRANVVRVGDAAGIANRFTGKGISQAIHSATLLAECVAEGELAEYPDRLHRGMRAEYLLASLATTVLAEGRPDLLADLLSAASGIDIEDIDRHPSRALARLLSHPSLAARLLSIPAARRSVWRALRDEWEYDDAFRPLTPRSSPR